MKIAALKPMAQIFFIKCRHFRFSHLLTPNVKLRGSPASGRVPLECRVGLFLALGEPFHELL